MNIFELLKMLSSESKAKMILHFLNCGRISASVNTLCDDFQLKQSNFSKHLMDLKKKKVVISEKVSKEIFYKINPEFADQYKELILDIFSKACPSMKLCTKNECANKE